MPEKFLKMEKMLSRLVDLTIEDDNSREQTYESSRETEEALKALGYIQ